MMNHTVSGTYQPSMYERRYVHCVTCLCALLLLFLLPLTVILERVLSKVYGLLESLNGVL